MSLCQGNLLCDNRKDGDLMITVEPNKEILKVKNTMYYGFEAKQLASMVLGVVCGIVFFIVLPWIYPLKCMLLVLCTSILMAFGFIEINNMSLVKFILKIISASRMMQPLVIKQDIKMKGDKPCI